MKNPAYPMVVAFLAACLAGCGSEAPQGHSASYVCREFGKGRNLWVNAYALEKQVKAVIFRVVPPSIAGATSGTPTKDGFFIMRNVGEYSDGSTSQVMYTSQMPATIVIDSRKYDLADGGVLFVDQDQTVKQFKAALPSTGPETYTSASWSTVIDSILASVPEMQEVIKRYSERRADGDAVNRAP